MKDFYENLISKNKEHSKAILKSQHTLTNNWYDSIPTIRAVQKDDLLKLSIPLEVCDLILDEINELKMDKNSFKNPNYASPNLKAFHFTPSNYRAKIV